MTQATISKHTYRLKITLPWLITIIFLGLITSIVTFLIFTGMSAKDMHHADKNTGNTETSVKHSSESFYRELSFQAAVICCLFIITLCTVFYTFKNLL